MNNNLNYYITVFFKDYLLNLKGVSKNTFLSYRDTFTLLLLYLKEKEKININNIKIDGINDNIVSDFLLYLENDRNNSILTRNQRLAAIHSFYNFIKFKELAYNELFTKILYIPFKKAPKKSISYFSKEEIEILINIPNSNEKYGFRDYILLLFMYETAARAHEIADLKRNQLFLNGNNSHVIIIGKGNKSRRVPINQDLSILLIKYIDIFSIDNETYLFKNRKSVKISTKGIEYILLKYLDKAREKYSEKFKLNYSNHSIRHSKAMHLLESGVNLIYIRDFLGHESVVTTEIYARSNPIIKEKSILENSKRINTTSKYDDNTKKDLLDFLKKL